MKIHSVHQHRDQMEVSFTSTGPDVRPFVNWLALAKFVHPLQHWSHLRKASTLFSLTLSISATTYYQPQGKPRPMVWLPPQFCRILCQDFTSISMAPLLQFGLFPFGFSYLVTPSDSGCWPQIENWRLSLAFKTHNYMRWPSSGLQPLGNLHYAPYACLKRSDRCLF